MDPYTSLGQIFMGEQHGVSLNDKVKSKGHWEGSEFQDTTNSSKKKVAKAFTFYKMETGEESDRYITHCFVSGLHAYDGEINLENEKNMISNEFAIKLLLNYEEKNGEKIMKKELLVVLNGELYFVKLIINPKQDDVEPDDLEGILEGINFGDIPQLDGIDVPPFVCNMGKGSQNKKKHFGKYKMTYSDEGPSLTLDVEIAIDEEEATEEVIRGYKTIREKNNPRVFVLLIRIKGKFDTPALANTGSNINVLPYRIYEKLGKEEVKHVSMKITMLDHSKAEPLGILKYVLCQVGVTTIREKFLILDIPKDKDVPIVKFYVAAVRNKQEESNDDDEDEYIIKRDKNGKPIYDLKFAKYLNCDDPMDLPLQHNEWIPSYCDNFINKGNGDGKWHAKVRIVDPYGNVYDQGSEKNFIETSRTNDFEAGSSSPPKITLQHETVEEAMLPRVHHEFLLWGTSNRSANTKYNTNLARLLPKQIYSSVIVDWEILNNMGCAEAAWRRAFDIRELVYAELCHEFNATYEFDETVIYEELMSRKVIKFRLGGRGHTLTILEFSRRLGMYSSDEIQDDGFETCFRRALRNDDHFNVNQYWSEINSENALILSRSSVGTIREPILRVLQKMITYGLCQRKSSYDKVQRNKIWLMSNFEANEHDCKVAKKKRSWKPEGEHDLLCAPIYCRSLDTTTLKELIDSNGRLIAEEPAPGDLRVVLGDYAPPSYDEEDED
ncbi:retrotransposon ORF1 [Tanacetum coccineum]